MPRFTLLVLFVCLASSHAALILTQKARVTSSRSGSFGFGNAVASSFNPQTPSDDDLRRFVVGSVSFNPPPNALAPEMFSTDTNSLVFGLPGASCNNPGEALAVVHDFVLIGCPGGEGGDTEGVVLAVSATSPSLPVRVRLQSLGLGIDAATASTGQAIAVSGDTVVISASNAKLVFALDISGSTSDPSTQDQVAVLHMPSYDEFGETVAVADELVFIQGDPDGSSTGEVVVAFGSTSTGYTHEGTISVPGLAPNSKFGDAIAVSADGTLLLVGAHRGDHPINNQGSVFVFTGYIGYSLVDRLLALDAAEDDYFGRSIALLEVGGGSGPLAVIGARGAGAAGAAYLFSVSKTEPGQQLHRLDPSGASSGADFGWSAVPVSHNRVLIGAYEDEDDAGAVYVLEVENGPDQCLPGKFGTTGSCTNCDPGRFSSSPGAAACDSCPPGRFQPSAAATSCDACPADMFTSEAGATQCSPCASGTSTNGQTGAAQCSPTSTGSCDACETYAPEGTFSVNSATTSACLCFSCL